MMTMTVHKSIYNVESLLKEKPSFDLKETLKDCKSNSFKVYRFMWKILQHHHKRTLTSSI